jgi:hypothetical protein
MHQKLLVRNIVSETLALMCWSLATACLHGQKTPYYP